MCLLWLCFYRFFYGKKQRIAVAQFSRVKSFLFGLFPAPVSNQQTNDRMPLFGKSQKTPAELVKALKEAVNSLERGDKKAEKAQEDVSKNLVSKIGAMRWTSIRRS